MPPGFRPPGMGSNAPGGTPLVPGVGGGMHMGPHDPLFAGRMRQPARGGGLPPGARWDPIRPPGMEVGHQLAMLCVLGSGYIVYLMCWQSWETSRLQPSCVIMASVRRATHTRELVSVLAQHACRASILRTSSDKGVGLACTLIWRNLVLGAQTGTACMADKNLAQLKHVRYSSQYLSRLNLIP